MRSALVTAVVLFCASLVAAQQPQQGQWELGIWAGGGHSVPGGTCCTGVFDAGVRVGKVLTAEHGHGFLRGELEYAVDVIPLYLVHTGSTTYAAGFDPFALKWNFTSAGRVVPYAELAGGVLFSRGDIPPGTNNVNFMSQANFGVQFFAHNDRAVVVSAKYVHISNAGLATLNPGINTLQFTVGYHWFH